jgi:ketosteroid isomerase-like protein
MKATFDEAEIRTAERALERALESSDPTAWVYAYTEDAVFVAPGAPAVQGRAALLEMTMAMNRLSSVSIEPLRTEGSGNVACVYGLASWVSGRPPDGGHTTKVRLIIVWRRETISGVWHKSSSMKSRLPTSRMTTPARSQIGT